MNNLSEINAEIVKKGYEAFIKADTHTLAELFDENVTWYTPGRSPVAGVYKGLQAVYAQLGRYGAVGSLKTELYHVSANDYGFAVGVHHNSAERNGKILDVWCSITFEIKNGKVICAKEFIDDLYNWDEFWA